MPWLTHLWVFGIPVLCWLALLPLIGMLWCCAPDDVASPSRWWLMALGAPHCMGLLIDKSTIRMLMFMNYFWPGPRPSLGTTGQFGKVVFPERATQHKAEISNYCFWNMQIMRYFLLFVNWKVNIGARGCVQDLAILVWLVTRALRDALEREGHLCTVQSSVLSTWQRWYCWMQSALKFTCLFLGWKNCSIRYMFDGISKSSQ